jgi:hypothetical protein
MDLFPIPIPFLPALRCRDQVQWLSYVLPFKDSWYIWALFLDLTIQRSWFSQS